MIAENTIRNEARLLDDERLLTAAILIDSVKNEIKRKIPNIRNHHSIQGD